MIRLISLLFLLTLPAYGQQDQWTSDAFGLFDPSTQPDRVKWAGLQGDEHRQTPETPETLQILMGEKSMVAGRSLAMAVALGLDRYGNLMGDGLTAVFTMSAEQGLRQGISKDGLAFVIVPATTEAGLFWATASLLGDTPLQSERQLYRITADMREVAPSVEGSAILDVRAAFSTPVLTDSFNNKVGEGQGFLFRIDSPDRIALIPGVSVKGQVQATLPRDLLQSQQSLGLQTNFRQDEDWVLAYPKPNLLADIPFTTSYDADLGLLTLSWGPLLTSDGYLVPDGERVRLNLETALFDPASTDTWVEAGMVHASLFLWAEDFPATLTLTSGFGTEVYQVRP